MLDGRHGGWWADDREGAAEARVAMSQAALAAVPNHPEPPVVASVAPLDQRNPWRRRSYVRLRNALWGVVGVLVLGVMGYVALGWQVGDAVYMVVITVGTVGYGEVQPIDTPLERVHTILLILMGTFALGYTVSALVSFVAEGEIQQFLGDQRTLRLMKELKDHVIVVGFGRMGSLLCAELTAAGLPIVLIDRTEANRAEVERRGHLLIVGDATDEKVLEDAGLARARALVCAIPSDAENVFITLTARQMAPELEIIARAEQPSTQKKLRQAGANHVVLPASIGATRITSLLTNPSAVEFTELVTKRSRLAIEMDEIVVREGGSLAGLSLRDADIGRRTGLIVIAVKRADGHLEFPPAGDQPFAPGDAIVVIGRRENLAQFREAFRV
jgi:voltage-gated potassium channel